MIKTNIKNKDVSRTICKNSNTYISLLTQSQLKDKKYKKTNHNSTAYHNYKTYVKKNTTLFIFYHGYSYYYISYEYIPIYLLYQTI